MRKPRLTNERITMILNDMEFGVSPPHVDLASYLNAVRDLRDARARIVEVEGENTQLKAQLVNSIQIGPVRRGELWPYPKEDEWTT